MRVGTCKEVKFHAKHAEKIPPKFLGEAGVSVANDMSWKRPILHYVREVQLSILFCGATGCGRHEGSILRKSIHHDHDNTKSIGLRQVSDEVHSHSFPWAFHYE